MTIDKLRKGQIAKIKSFNEESMKGFAMRLGLDNGVTVCCHEVIPAGPIILKKGHQEIAVGRNLAKKIEIEAVQ